jgi:hypothetical protein
MRAGYRPCSVEAAGQAGKPLANNRSLHSRQGSTAQDILIGRNPSSFHFIFQGFCNVFLISSNRRPPSGSEQKYLFTYAASTVPKIKRGNLLMKPGVAVPISHYAADFRKLVGKCFP